MSEVIVEPMIRKNFASKDDIGRLKDLISGVGWDLESTKETDSRLREIGIRYIRCMGIEPVDGVFSADGRFEVREPKLLDKKLRSCREVGADPHVVIGTSLPESLRRKDSAASAAGHPEVHGPTDWPAYRNYCEAVFEYVVLTRGFRHARFEVGNEPDIGGTVTVAAPKPANGSAALYAEYLTLYQNVSEAARSFEKKHPGSHVNLGGPALGWVYTFGRGDFNWSQRFPDDCRRLNLKLDFIGLHFYGNTAPLRPGTRDSRLSFAAMMKVTRDYSARFSSRVPIVITEWGASYHAGDPTPWGLVNGSELGAAWSAAFLDAALTAGVTSAIYLASTDARKKREGEDAFQNIWSWPALFVNPFVFGGAWPKASYNLFSLVHRLEANRVNVVTGTENSFCLASVDEKTRSVSILFWNYDGLIPENAAPSDCSVARDVDVVVDRATKFAGGEDISGEVWRLDANRANAWGIYSKLGTVGADAELRSEPLANARHTKRGLEFRLHLEPSAVVLVTLSRTSISQAANERAK